MKSFIALTVLSLAAGPMFAHADTNVELVGTCLASVEKELDFFNDDQTGCIGGAFVDNVDEINGDVYTVAYGRSACEGAVSGTAEATLKILKQQTVGGKSQISKCNVLKLVITDESAD